MCPQLRILLTSLEFYSKNRSLFFSFLKVPKIDKNILHIFICFLLSKWVRDSEKDSKWCFFRIFFFYLLFVFSPLSEYCLLSCLLLPAKFNEDKSSLERGLFLFQRFFSFREEVQKNKNTSISEIHIENNESEREKHQKKLHKFTNTICMHTETLWKK